MPHDDDGAMNLAEDPRHCLCGSPKGERASVQLMSRRGLMSAYKYSHLELYKKNAWQPYCTPYAQGLHAAYLFLRDILIPQSYGRTSHLAINFRLMYMAQRDCISIATEAKDAVATLPSCTCPLAAG